MRKNNSFNHKKEPKKGFNHIAPKDTRILMPEHKHPIFCFKYLQKNAVQNCTADEQRLFLNQIVELSQMKWEEIIKSPRHGRGTEKINRTSLKVGCPSFITDDVTFLLALRFQAKKPFLVHRDRFICHIIFIDNGFDVYDHE